MGGRVLIVDYVVAEFVRWVLYTMLPYIYIHLNEVPLLVRVVPAGLPAVDGRDVVVGARHGAPSQLRGPDITGARRRYVLTCCKKKKTGVRLIPCTRTDKNGVIGAGVWTRLNWNLRTILWNVRFGEIIGGRREDIL